MRRSSLPRLNEDVLEVLDSDHDGQLSRADLREAARRLQWHWHEAPLYAVLDRLALDGPLSRAAFASCLAQMARDPLGPFGDVLLRASAPPAGARAPDAVGSTQAELGSQEALGDGAVAMLDELERVAGASVAADYHALLLELDEPHLPLRVEQAALLVIDPQRSFTVGACSCWAGARSTAACGSRPSRLTSSSAPRA